MYSKRFPGNICFKPINSEATNTFDSRVPLNAWLGVQNRENFLNRKVVCITNLLVDFKSVTSISCQFDFGEISSPLLEYDHCLFALDNFLIIDDPQRFE